MLLYKATYKRGTHEKTLMFKICSRILWCTTVRLWRKHDKQNFPLCSDFSCASPPLHLKQQDCTCWYNFGDKTTYKLNDAGESQCTTCWCSFMETKIRSWTFNSICSTLIDIDELVCLLLLSWPQPISMQHSIASLRDALTGLLCNSNIVSRRIKPHGPEFVYCPLCAVKCFSWLGMTVMLTLSSVCLKWNRRLVYWTLLQEHTV